MLPTFLTGSKCDFQRGGANLLLATVNVEPCYIIFTRDIFHLHSTSIHIIRFNSPYTVHAFYSMAKTFNVLPPARMTLQRSFSSHICFHCLSCTGKLNLWPFFAFVDLPSLLASPFFFFHYYQTAKLSFENDQKLTS